MNVLAPEAVTRGETYQIQFRHRSKPVPAQLKEMTDECWSLEFLETAKSVTPGQSAVLYQGDLVVAGGRIAELVTPR